MRGNNKVYADEQLRFEKIFYFPWVAPENMNFLKKERWYVYFSHIKVGPSPSIKLLSFASMKTL